MMFLGAATDADPLPIHKMAQAAAGCGGLTVAMYVSFAYPWPYGAACPHVVCTDSMRAAKFLNLPQNIRRRRWPRAAAA